MPNQLTIDDSRAGQHADLFNDSEDVAELWIETDCPLCFCVKPEDAEGMVVFSLNNARRETGSSYSLALPHAVELKGSQPHLFVLSSVRQGDTLKIGRGLRRGRVRVLVSLAVPATPENCKLVEEFTGKPVTPHPVWHLPNLGLLAA